MSTALAKGNFPAEKIALLKKTICPDLTDSELELFAAICEKTGLDPFSKQIYATKRAPKKGEAPKLTIQVGIDGFRLIAERTQQLDGQEGPYWCGPDGVWKDVWLENVVPMAAKVCVWRKGCSRPFSGIARFSEYAQTYPDGNLMGLWSKMAATMIAKCAEALALRKGFPQDLSGLYIKEEMDQADNPDPPASKPVVTSSPPPAIAPKLDAIVPGDPVSDMIALMDLARKKGWEWQQIVANLNEKFGTKYSLMRTKWIEIAAAHRAAIVEGLNRQPDHVPNPGKVTGDGNTVTDFAILLERWCEWDGKTPVEIFNRMCEVANWGSVRMYDDLKPEQLTQGCESLRKKIAAKQQSKSG